MSTLSSRASIRIGTRLLEVALERRGARVVATVDGREYRLNVHEPQRGVYSLLPLDDGGESVEVQVAAPRDVSGSCRVRVRGRVFDACTQQAGNRAPSFRPDQEGESTIKSVMPGRIVRLLVKPGQHVKRGQGIIVMEAMKMENELASPKDGAVQKILVAPGDRVESGAKLAVIV